jgi:hypothetical protein
MLHNIIKIRFNTEHGTTNHLWRILLDNKEYLATDVTIHVPCFTSTDTLTDGRVKHHITAYYNDLQWDNNRLTIV